MGLIGGHVMGIHSGIARMRTRDHQARLGQLFATLIHNAQASPQSQQPHPIALIGATFGRALMRGTSSAQRHLTALVAAAGTAISMTSIMPATQTEQRRAKCAGAQQKNVGHVLAKRRKKLDLLPIFTQGARCPRPCVT